MKNSNLIKSCCLFILAVFAFQRAISSPLTNKLLPFENYSVEDGLTDYTINSIFQDSYGYIWIGTGNGVCRFDSYSIKQMNIYKDPAAGKVRNVYCFYENENKDIYIGTDNGLFLFERNNEYIRLLIGPDSSKNELFISNIAVKKITGDSKGNLWLGTYNGLYKIDRDGNTKTFLYADETSDQPVSITDFSFINDTILYMGTNIGLMMLNTENEKFETFKHFNDKTIKTPNEKNVTSLQKYKRDKLYVGTWGMGLFVFDLKQKRFIKRYQETSANKNGLSSNVIFSLNKDATGNIWIGTENNGLNKFCVRDESFVVFKSIDYQLNSIAGNTIKCIAIDNHEDLWLGTFMGGISKLDFHKMKFNHYQHYFSINNSLSNNKTTSFLELDQNDIWIGTDGGGINRFNPQNGNFRHYREKDNFSINSDFIMSLKNIDNQIWAGTYNKGINVIDKQGNLIKTYKMSLEDSLSLSGNNISCVFKDSKDRIWIGVTYNLPCRYMGNDQFERIEYGKNSNIELRSVHDFLEDENGNIWFGGNGDLIKLDSVLNGQYYFSEHEIFPHINGFIKPSITSLDQDISGNILVGTRGFGLVIYNPNSKKVKTLSKKDGLPSNDIAGITISRDNSTWISTGNGLLNINTKDLFFKDTLIVHTYDVKDGLQGNTFITGAILCTKDGMIYVGGNNGFNAFNPNLLIKNKQTSPVYITQLKINHQSVHKESKILNNNSIQAINEIKLKHNQSTITLNFTAVDFKSSDKIQYQYRLTGFENKWNKSGIERKATYTNLDPGIYKFNVKAANSSGIWNQKPTTLKITILPPWWQTWWAAILYLVIVTISVLLFRRFLIAKERKRNQLALEKMEVSKEKELSKLKLQFFTNISHELRTPLSLIGGPVEQLLTKNNYDREQKIQLNLVRRNTRRLVQLVDQLMDFRKLESQTLPYNPTKDNLIYHIKLIYNDFIYLAESKNIDYTFYSNKNEFHTAFDADKLQKIISNLISNAFKFSKTNGKIGIYVEVDESAKKYCIEVSDNGIGISEQHLKNIFNPFYQAHTEYFNKHKGTGIGLTLCKALVEVHGGKIEVISNKNGISDTGFNTIFRIKIPVRDDLTNINHSMPYDSKSTDYMEDILELSLLEEYLPDQQEKPTVLLVEDNIDVKTFIQLHLSRFYNFITADNGLNGLESAKEHLPDLIVSDVIMPEMDGVEMCHELKQITDTSHIPIIMLTAKTSDESIVDGLKTGIDTYITKPFNINILASYINNILKNRNEIYERYKKSYFVDSYKIYSTETDEKFLEKIHQILKDNLSDFSFGVDRLSREVGMSRTNFYKKIKKLTGLTVNEFIKNYKLKVAASLLIKSELNINEIVYEIGLKDASYFSRCFKETFGCLPSEFYEKYKLNNENVLSPK